MITKFTSSKEIIAKIYNDLNIQEEGRFASIIEWVGECLELVGCTELHEDKIATIDIKNHRGVLPCDFIYEISVNQAGYAQTVNTSNFKNLITEADDQDIPNATFPGNNSYSINYPYINHTLRDTTVDLVYKGVRTDEDGLPLVPDQIQFKEGCVLYVMSKFTQAKYASGKANFNEFKAIKEEAMKMLDKAATHIQMPNPGKMQSIAQRWLRLIPNIKDFEENFVTANHLQQSYKHK